MTEATTTPKKATKKAPKAAKSPAKKTSEEGGLFATIATGGKQYRVQAGDTIKIEKLSDSAKASTDKQGWQEGDTITFDNVLMIDNGG
ncbi:MAG: bL21 family ribosomal protein, partial [Patescibacteria group bacterium]